MNYNATFYDGSYEGMGRRMIEGLQNGEKLHGGTFANLLYHQPNIAYYTLETILDDGLLDPPPTSLAEFAAVCDWNEPEHAADFVAEYSSENHGDVGQCLGELLTRQ